MNRIVLPGELFGVSALIAPALSQTAPRQTVTQFTDWFSSSSTIKASNRFSVFVDAQFRFVDWREAAQHQIRVRGDFEISKSFSFMPVGYVYIHNYQYGKQPATHLNNEHRIFQQFTFKHKTFGINLQYRLRTEERFLQKHHTDTNGDVLDDGFSNQ